MRFLIFYKSHHVVYYNRCKEELSLQGDYKGDFKMTIVKWNNRKVEKFEDTEIICVNRGEYKECKDLKIGDCRWGLLVVAVKHVK